MSERGYTVGVMEPEWGMGEAQTLTFIVTEDCNLRCKYCYITHKSKNKVMKLETAKKFIDYVLTSKSIHKCKSVILDFIGGEPLLEAKLIEDISDYFKVRAFEENLQWYWRYMINISTNGVNYADADVQNLINKNEGKISIGITIDGTKDKHDLQRVFPDGTGSYDIIHKNLKLWLSQFPGSTKVTFASEDLKYLKESIIHLWNQGVHSIAANVVFEDVWQDGDDKIFENQLKDLADYIIDQDLYDKYYCTLFLEYLGSPYEKEDLDNTTCGAGKMMALSPDGNIYPCLRYYDYSLNHKSGYVIGNVDEGIDFEKSRVFLLAMYKYQCDEECLNCPIAKGCEFCQGFSYDEADTETNFQKAKYICKMHKARVRANNYYFTKLFHKKNIKRKNFTYKNELAFILDDNYMSVCSYQNNENKRGGYMLKSDILRGLKFAEENFMQPIFIHSKEIREEHLRDYDEIDIIHRIPIEAFNDKLPFYNYQIVIDLKSIDLIERMDNENNVIFNIHQDNIDQLAACLEKLLEKCERINVNIQGFSKDFNCQEYEYQLSKCVKSLFTYYKKKGVLKEINIITDLLFIKEHEECSAGENSFAYAPDNKIYICPAFYGEGKESIGNFDEGIKIKNSQLYTFKYMPLCQECDAYQCENCKYTNLLNTNEVNVPPSFQCKKAQYERRASYMLQSLLKNSITFDNELENKSCIDPISIFMNYNNFSSYYKIGE